MLELTILILLFEKTSCCCLLWPVNQVLFFVSSSAQCWP